MACVCERVRLSVGVFVCEVCVCVSVTVCVSAYELVSVWVCLRVYVSECV